MTQKKWHYDALAEANKIIANEVKRSGETVTVFCYHSKITDCTFAKKALIF